MLYYNPYKKYYLAYVICRVCQQISPSQQYYLSYVICVMSNMYVPWHAIPKKPLISRGMIRSQEGVCMSLRYWLKETLEDIIWPFKPFPSGEEREMDGDCIIIGICKILSCLIVDMELKHIYKTWREYWCSSFVYWASPTIHIARTPLNCATIVLHHNWDM